MSITFRTNAIPLGKRAVRETDRVYSVLTETHGRLDLLAKGSRKILSKLAGEMEHFGILDLFVVRGRVFDRLAGVKPIRVHTAILDSLERRLLVMNAAAFLERALKVGYKDPALFRLAAEFLEAVDSASPTALGDGRLALAFQWKVFARLGFRPELEKCVRCRSPVGEEASITVRHGGMVCADCQASGRVLDAAPISREERKALAFLLESPLAECRRLFLSPALRAGMAALTSAWSQTHLELEAIGV